MEHYITLSELMDIGVFLMYFIMAFIAVLEYINHKNNKKK